MNKKERASMEDTGGVKKKILLVSHKISVGGASRMLVELADYLANLDKYDVSLLTFKDSSLPWVLNEKISHCEFTLPKGKSIYHPLQLIRIRKKIREIRPDLIISFLVTPNVCSIFSAFGTKTRVLISERGDPFEHRKNSKFSRVEKFFYNFTDGIVFQTLGARDAYNRHIQKKSVIIPNPINTNNFPPVDFGTRLVENIIVNVGNFKIAHKRQDVLIEAFSLITASFPENKLVLYGDGVDKARIEGLINEKNLGDKVILAGLSDNIPASIKNAKLFVMPSDSEGMPNALIEAMAMGIPVVSTDCSPGGAAFLIENYVNGMLVPRADPVKMSEAMKYMLTNQEKAMKMGMEAMKIRDRLNAEKIYPMWDEYIMKLLS